MERTKANKCSDGRRHSWSGIEEMHFHGSVTHQRKEKCSKCQTYRLIEYTKNGNHVAGYLYPDPA